MSDWARARDKPARVVWTGVNGLFGFVCNDFGEKFEVIDTNGENPRSAIISSITRGEETVKFIVIYLVFVFSKKKI